MALSTKVIAAYKESTNSIVQVEKDARVALRTSAIGFGLRVREHALLLIAKDKRKSFKLGDVVTAVSYCLAQDFSGIQIDAFIDAIFGSSVPYSVEKNEAGNKVVSYSTFTEEQTSHLFIDQAGHCQINHKNTLRISEIERILATTRRAHRTANAFLAVCMDQYVQNILTAAESRVTQDKKKRIKVEHLNLKPLTPDVEAALKAFVEKSKTSASAEEAAEDASAEPADSVVDAPVAEVADTVAAAPAAPAVIEVPKPAEPVVAIPAEETVKSESAAESRPAKKARTKKVVA